MCVCVFKSDNSFSKLCVNGNNIPIYVFKIHFSTCVDYSTVMELILPFQGTLERW